MATRVTAHRGGGASKRRRGALGHAPRLYLVAAAASLAAWLAAARGGAGAAGMLALALCATAALVPLLGGFARRHDITARPGGRSIHEKTTPLLGGLAIAVPVLVALALAGGPKYLSLAVACGLMTAGGVFDDLYRLQPARKILLQVIAAGVLYAGGFRLPGFFAGAAAELGLLLLWVLLVANAVNLSDGIDGLAAGVSLVAAAACVALGSAGAVPVVLVGALLGFLWHNLPPAAVFLGDAGSQLLGILLAALLTDLPGGMNLPVALGVLALPLGDAAISVVRRWLRGKPVYTADRDHTHHQLLRAWGRPGVVLAVLTAFAAAQAGLVLWMPDLYGLACAAGLWIFLGGYLMSRTPLRVVETLRRRARFKRLHLLREYAENSLRLAPTSREVLPILEHVARLTKPAANGAARGLEEERRAILSDVMRAAASILVRRGDLARTADAEERLADLVAASASAPLRPLATSAGRRGEA